LYYFVGTGANEHSKLYYSVIIIIDSTFSKVYLPFCRSWNLPGAHNVQYGTDKTPACHLCDAETKYELELEVDGNVAYGISTFKDSVKEENVVYGAVDNQGLTSENAGCGTSANEVPTSENTSTN
jgi:hypothetical protein